VTAAAAQRQSILPGLGASEIAAAAGLDPFKSPLQLWLEHTGQAPPFDGNEATDWGLEVEPAILRVYEKTRLDDGERLMRPAESVYKRGSDWKRCTPDGLVYAEQQLRRLVQVKNVGFRMMHRWMEGPPDYVVCQVQWELHVLEMERGDVMASLGGSAPEGYTLWRDEAMIRDLDLIAERYWRHVQERTEPRTTHHEDWAAYLARRAKSRGFIVPIDSVDSALIEEWRESNAALKAAEKKSDLARNKVRRYLADANADGMETAHGIATWRPDKNGNRSLRAPKGFGADKE
jgi:putative phage-type endonuclease